MCPLTTDVAPACGIAVRDVRQRQFDDHPGLPVVTAGLRTCRGRDPACGTIPQAQQWPAAAQPPRADLATHRNSTRISGCVLWPAGREMAAGQPRTDGGTAVAAGSRPAIAGTV